MIDGTFKNRVAKTLINYLNIPKIFMKNNYYVELLLFPKYPIMEIAFTFFLCFTDICSKIALNVFN